MAKLDVNATQIVVPAPKRVVQPALSEIGIKPIPIFIPQVWAPAWFYSALNWLSKTFYDASNVRQVFSNFLVGSDVDPYVQLGSTRLFIISMLRNTFRLTLAADANSSAATSGGTTYANTDAGIKQMYLDLSASSIFASVNYCYIPAQTNTDTAANEVSVDSYKGGYDPATGLRMVVLGSAVSQVVPLDDFLKTQNEQIYNESPVIVPIVKALVYDVTENNTLGATTFNLPVFYTPDQVSAGNYYVNKLGWSGTVAGQTAHYGQTALFPGGPGYTDSTATALKLDSTAVVATGGEIFTVYTFDTAKVTTTSTLSPKVQTGVMSLSYSGASPASIFANQSIIGFYRDAAWTTCLGIPIYDFGVFNSSFTATALPQNAPLLIYSSADSFLNGGTLQNAVRRLSQATYVYSPDQLISILDAAIAAKDKSNGVGLSVTTAALDFNLSSTPAASVVDQLSVPVLASVTTTPAPVVLPPGRTLTNVPVGVVAEVPTATLSVAIKTPTATAAPAATVSAPASTVNVAAASVALPPKPITGTVTGSIPLQPIGGGANNPSPSQPGPVTVQVSLTASVPREALNGTGITSIEIGTAFPQQTIGSGATFQSETAGTVLNLMNWGKPALAPFNLTVASAGIAFTAGVSYVLSLNGTNLTSRGSDGSSVSGTIPASSNPDTTHAYVGAMVYSTSTATVPLYPLLQLSLPAPGVGTHGVLQGQTYGVRLTYGDANSQYDVVDSTQTTVDSNIGVPNPKPTDNSTPQQGGLYFGTFIGGATNMTVWSVPIFLTVIPSQLPGASFNGNMTLTAQASGVPEYQLQITDSSLFVYSNINVDTSSVGSISASNVFLASAVINDSPDDLSSKAFAPCKLLMGLIRQVQMGTVLKYVFIPEDDSVVIGGIRYMLSVINLEANDDDPNSRPYPPVFWPQARYWQFANRHNPYLDVRYTGATQAARISQAQADTARIGLQTANAQEPMQMYLDTTPGEMTVWPIFAFPYATSAQSVDVGQLKAITTTILQILSAPPAATPAAPSGPLAGEQIALPSSLQQSNPYTAGSATIADQNPTVGNSILMTAANPSLTGALLTNLSPNFIANTSISGTAALQSVEALKTQQSAADLAITKSLAPQPDVLQVRTMGTTAQIASYARQYQSIFGFSVYNPATGEAYIIEVVNSDLAIPDQLPNPTENVTYDPYYARVVFLNTLTCYNMSIIVPSMVRDQYGNLASQGTPYQNVLSKTDELTLGYMYSLYDSTNNFDNLTFNPYPATILLAINRSQNYIYTNNPYSTQQTVLFSPVSLFGQTPVVSLTTEREAAAFNLSSILFIPAPTPPAYFVCRRQNWNSDCHLMQATQPTGKSVYLAFGGGDLVPFRLDAPFTVDKRLPTHMYKLTYTFADQQYDAAQTFSISNQPYVVAVASQGGVTQYVNFSINSTAGTADLQIGNSKPLQFPTQIYVVGEASTTLTSVSQLNSTLKTNFTDTGDFVNQDAQGNVLCQEFRVIPYNNLVYLIRAVSNVQALGQVGGVGTIAGLLVDTFVPATTGNLALAQAARYKQSGLQYFGSTYTATTMVDTLDTLDFTSITGQTFYAPTIFIPIAELDSNKGFVANLSNFLGEQFWTFIYPEIVAQLGATVNGVSYPNGFNLDNDGKPILSLQKLHFVYDPLAVLFTPNDLTHAYPLQPKQQVLALTNGQVQEGICWRSANVQAQRTPPHNVCAQQILPTGLGMERPNIVYSSHNRAVETATESSYLGMSVHSFVSLSGVTYNIEESALSTDQTGSSFISAVSSISNILIGVLFDYDNNEQGSLSTYDHTKTTKGVVFLNGYLNASGFNFSSPDHFDVNDVLPSQVPLLDEIADILGWDVAFYNTDASLPRQFWSLTYDSFTAPGVTNYIPNVPPAPADPNFTNRTRSLILSLQNPVRPTQLGLMDTYSSVVSANLHLQNGVTGSIFLSKKADRDIASIGSNQTNVNANALYGMPTKYDFFIFSRDHYWTLKGATFELIDQGYAMCLVDDSTGTGTKVASYYIDTDGNYYELYNYVLYSPTAGVIETFPFTVKVTLGTPANLSATPIIPETPNSVNPQDIVTQINKLSNLIYAAFGASSPGQPPAYVPIQTVLPEGLQAAPIIGLPGATGYSLNVVGTSNRQPVLISQIYSANVAYTIAGSTTIVPYNVKAAKAVPFYGSISHGLDKQVSVPLLQSKDLSSYIPRTTVPAGPSAGVYGGDGLGALIGTQFSCAFQGSGAIPPAIASNPTPGTTMKADDSIFYTFNAVSNISMDSIGKSVTAAAGQYFMDEADPTNPIYGVVTLPKFILNTNTCTVNLSTTLSDGVTSRYTLVIGGKSYLFGPDNAHVTADRTMFTFNPLSQGIYSVTYAAIDAPAGSEAPTPITLTPFTITAGGVSLPIDVFNDPGGLKGIVLGVIGRQYTYDPIHATVTVTAGTTSTTSPLSTGLVIASTSGYGYVVGISNGAYTVNGSLMFPYSASTSGSPATYALLTAPQMFTLGGNFYTFNQDGAGDYLSVTGNGQTYPINPYQFSITGTVYIINTNVQPNTVVGGGNIYPMTANNTQFVLNGVQYTITLKAGSLNGATISGQFNITQGNVVIVENYVYELDIPNGQIVGNGNTYPLTTSGFTYTITTANQSFTVTTEPNATTATIGNILYLINNTTVVGDGVTYPILIYRTFVDGATTYDIGLDGTVSVPPALALSGTAPYTGSTFTDGGATYTVNELAAYDGTKYYPISGTIPQFITATLTYQLRNDGVSITAGPAKTYITTTGALSPNQFTFGTLTIFFGRATDVAAFDGTHYYAIANNQFTDTTTGNTYTLSGNTAVHAGNSYEIYSNLGQGAYFEVLGGPTYYVNVAVADTGTPNGNIYSVFPITGGSFTMPLLYTLAISGSAVTVNAVTFTAGATAVSTLTASGGALTGGYFKDPVTNIVYTCIVNAGVVTFVDSNNVTYSYSTTTNTFTAAVVVTTAVNLAVDSETTPAIYPVLNNQFTVDTTTYTVNVPVAYQNAAAGPYWPMINGRFIVPKTAPVSNLAYTVKGGNVIKGYVLNNDDEFSPDGNVVYTVNEVNVVKATNQATLGGTAPNQSITAGSITYSINSTTSLASFSPAGLTYNTGTKQFTVSYNGVAVTYTVGATSVTDNRHPANTFTATVAGTQLTFTDTVSGVTFTFNDSGNNSITAEFVYSNQFFVDVINGTTYFVDTTDNRVEVISYLPETTQYAFVPADGNTYLIHYNNVNVVFPVVAGANVNVGVATVGSDTFSVDVDEVEPASGGTGIPINQNSFEINGNLYTIAGTSKSPTDYSSCSVVGDATPPKPFLSANTFKLTDPSVIYTLQLDSNNLPSTIKANFAVSPSRNLINVNDSVYLISYNTVSTGSLLGQGQTSIAITNSSFTLSNPFDTTKAKFIFDDMNIYDAGSVVGQFNAYLAPTFFIGGATYTLNTVNLAVTDNNDHPYPLLTNPVMFSINGFNYVIDTNHVPHNIVGNNNVSPISTDVTVQSGHPIPNTTFTLNGQIYAYVEDLLGNLMTILGTKSYMIAQPGLTFKLDSSLVFTISTTAPAAGTYPGSITPIGTVTAGTLVLNLYAGTNESGGSDFFMYKNVLYTLVKSSGVYVSVQKSYTVYAAQPAVTQQQLAVFNLGGTTYLVTDGTTTGVGTAAGINPGTMWARTSNASLETQFGLVYGFTAQPTNVIQSGTGVFQFMVTNASGQVTLYDIVYTAGSNANLVKVDVPSALPTFTQSWFFNFVTSYPLTFETGGYNAFTTFVSETEPPNESFAGAYKTPIISTDSKVDTLLGSQGDFSVEFWHSLSLTPVAAYHPCTYRASTSNPLIYYVDVDFEDPSDIYVRINNTVMRAGTTAPVFSSRWRHFALTYSQPYVIVCQGAGYEVKQASNYDFDRDFSIAMTFAASDVDTNQGILYKGTGSDTTSPQLSMSYRVAVSGAAVTLTLTDRDQNLAGPFTGPAVLQPGQFYQVIIVKHTSTPAGNSGSTDPYAPPFDVSEYAGAAQSGGNATISSLPSGGGAITISKVAQADTGATPNLTAFTSKLTSQTSSSSYNVTISVRTVNDNGTFGAWQSNTSSHTVSDDGGLIVNPTGSAHLLIGAAYDDSGISRPLGTIANPGNVREVYLFGHAINSQGITTKAGVVDIASASSAQLLQAGLLGYWQAQYDPNGVVNNTVNPTDVAISTNASLASLNPLSGHELEGTTLYIDGYDLPLSLVTTNIPTSMPIYASGSPLLDFNAGPYKLEEISVWTMTRQPYQIIDDMFGRLVPSNEPFLVVYLSGSFQVQATTAPILPMSEYIDNTIVTNLVTSMSLTFSSASLDLMGSPAVSTCGPLVSPNLYTPPGAALTVCDTVPYMTTYSITLNSVTGTLAGEINEAYVYIKDHVLTLYAGKKVGDLVLTWVSQEQGDVQVMGFVEGAPPCPMANLTNKPSYAGATSVTLSAPTSVTLKYQQSGDNTTENSSETSISFGGGFGLDAKMAPVGFGFGLDKKAIVDLDLSYGQTGTSATTNGTGTQNTASEKLDESNKFTVKMQGTVAPYTGDLFMSSLNTLTTPSNTAGNPSSKTAILPNPNLGGFTTSNPPGALPKAAPTEEKFGQRMYVPSPYGQAFVTSATLDVYQQTLLQTGTVYGFVRIPNTQIPRDLNIISFRMSSKYLRPGCLDGVVGYAYNPATLPSGAKTYTTSTGEMTPVYDGNFSPGEVGHNASYMKVVEAYQVKKQIDLQAFNTLALYQTAYNNSNETLPDPTLTPALDFYDEYIWSSRGGTQEVKHTYTTTYDEVYSTTTVTTNTPEKNVFNIKLTATTVTIFDIKTTSFTTTKDTAKYSYNTTATSSFDITASFDGIESDTQMRYSSNNDAHFVMNFNSMFNPNNQSGLNLVIGSDGLVYNIIPSVSSGAGLPTSDNIDTNMTYTQPQPAYTTGNADGLTGNLEPYDRPGKTNLFRIYAFFLQPTQQNADDFWDTVIDQVWLANSQDADAAAMRSAIGSNSIPWRLFYRVTYSERFLPPVSTVATVVPQITPVMAVPVMNPASDFIFQKIGALPRPAHNPLNDIEANIVLAAPTVSGISAGTIPTTGPNVGQPVVPNNVIPFDLIKSTVPIVNWGDTNNAKTLTQLLTSVLGLNTVPMTLAVLPGSTLIAQVIDPVHGGPLYSIYSDPNGLTVNVPTNFGITVYQDVNGNPIQYYDGKTFHSLQSDYVASPDGTILYYIQPPSTYDQTAFNVLGDYDLFGHPGDEWRYYLVSGMSANMTSGPTVTGVGPFLSSGQYTGFTIATAQHAKSGANQVPGYVLVQGVLQYPNLNTTAETFSDVLVYKAMSLLDTFPIGDPEVLIAFLQTQYPGAPFVGNDEINQVFARNIVSYFNNAQQALLPQ